MDRKKLAACRSIGGQLAVYIRNKGDSLPSTSELLAVSADLSGNNEELLIPLKALVAQPAFHALAAQAGTGRGLIQLNALLDGLSSTLSGTAIEDLREVLHGMLDLKPSISLSSGGKPGNATEVKSRNQKRKRTIFTIHQAERLPA